VRSPPIPIAMTSNVKSELSIFWHVLHPVSSSSGGTASVGRVGARKTRRLSLLLSVGWLPPSLSPLGACLGIEGVPLPGCKDDPQDIAGEARPAIVWPSPRGGPVGGAAQVGGQGQG
jgi:hypothetical protein